MTQYRSEDDIAGAVGLVWDVKMGGERVAALEICEVSTFLRAAPDGLAK